MKLKLPDSSKNWISLVGATIALITFSMIVFLFIITSVTHSGNTYLGLIIYVLLPGILFIGLLLIPIGMWLKTRRDKRRTEEERK
ncbi:MAG: cytochrome C, partial [Ignavibacteria bacterium]|nr:cytochrome C [Ignavibacteria bacterium]